MPLTYDGRNISDDEAREMERAWRDKADYEREEVIRDIFLRAIDSYAKRMSPDDPAEFTRDLRMIVGQDLYTNMVVAVLEYMVMKYEEETESGSHDGEQWIIDKALSRNW